MGKFTHSDRTENWVLNQNGAKFAAERDLKQASITYRLPYESFLDFPNKFVGPKKCGECHPAQYASWESSRHAKTVRFPHEMEEVGGAEGLKNLCITLKLLFYLIDRWTYWEKFDYLAVFWGMFIIGISGLILWFPAFFGKFLPGEAINLATLLHSDEALLATGFIFAIHFFNTHFRADRFPMDMVILSGSISEEEIEQERNV